LTRTFVRIGRTRSKAERGEARLLTEDCCQQVARPRETWGRADFAFDSQLVLNSGVREKVGSVGLGSRHPVFCRPQP